MKQNRFTFRPFALSSLLLLAAGGCARTEKSVVISLPPNPEITPGMTLVSRSPGVVAIPAVASPGIAVANWPDIEGYSYEMRAAFFNGLRQLEASVDVQISELTTKRAAMGGTAQTRGWDFAMKEMGDARSYLRSMREEANQATPETWPQQKSKVGEAWVRTQSAYQNVKFSTTI